MISPPGKERERELLHIRIFYEVSCFIHLELLYPSCPRQSKSSYLVMDPCPCQSNDQFAFVKGRVNFGCESPEQCPLSSIRSFPCHMFLLMLYLGFRVESCRLLPQVPLEAVCAPFVSF